MNPHFNITRFINYGRYNILLNKKTYLFAILGLAASLFLLVFIIGLNSAFRHQSNWVALYFISMSIVLVPIIGYAFPAFRNKEIATRYYVLPASILEKYIYEFLLKIVIIPLLFALIFPIISNMAIAMSEYIFSIFSTYTEKQNTTFSYDDLGKFISSQKYMTTIIIIVFTLTSSLLFTGATAFRKHPLIQTVIFVGLIVLTTIGYFYILFEKFRLKNGIRFLVNKIFQENETVAFNYLFIAIILTATSALSYAYFKLKERQV